MDVGYIYCPNCGYEDFNVPVEFSRTVANGDLFLCPMCKEETSHFEIEE